MLLFNFQQKGNQDFANHGEEEGEEEERQEETKEEKAIGKVIYLGVTFPVFFFLRSSTSGESGSDTKTEKPAKETKGRTVIQASLKNFLLF